MQELLLLFLEGRKDAEERIFFFFWLKSISLIINPRPRMAFANVKRWLGNTFTSPLPLRTIQFCVRFIIGI